MILAEAVTGPAKAVLTLLVEEPEANKETLKAIAEPLSGPPRFNNSPHSKPISTLEMRAVDYKKQFKKDYQRIDRTGRDLTRLFDAISLLQAGEPLPPHCRDHQLTGNLKDCRECHLGGAWLLLYQRNDETLIPIRTGSHSELFK